MTKYQQTANPNATNSELDAKTILQRGVEAVSYTHLTQPTIYSV